MSCRRREVRTPAREAPINDETYRSGALANAASWREDVRNRTESARTQGRLTDVVVGAVAGAEPAAKVTGLTDGHTTQVGADTQHDQPLRALSAVLITLRVTETLPLDLAGFINLTLGTVTDEDGLATPLDDDLLMRC